MLELSRTRDNNLSAACEHNVGNCDEELLKVREAFSSYDSKDVLDDNYNLRTQACHTATQFGLASSSRMEAIAKKALTDLAKENIESMGEVITVTSKAAGDKEAQATLLAMGQSIKNFAKDPDGTLSDYANSTLAEADRLEALGRKTEADYIRVKLVLEGELTAVSVVTGVTGIAKGVSKVGSVEKAVKITDEITDTATVNPPPFTGNGFTKAENGQIIPEFRFNNLLLRCDGIFSSLYCYRG